MTTAPPLRIPDRLRELLRHLGMDRVHVAGSMPGDWRDFAAASPGHIASLSLVCPTGFDAEAVSAIGSRLLVFHGDRSPTAERVSPAVRRVSGATLVTLDGYPGVPFADLAAERGDEIGPALLDFLERIERQSPSAVATVSPGAGKIAGLSYRITGSGPPLLLLPLALAPSQWEPLLPQLNERFCTIRLSGPHLGYMPILEGRGQAPGYMRIVQNLLEEVALRPGETILDVGCGPGAMARWLAQHTRGAHAITAVDINPYLLQEAAALVRKAEMQDVITLQEGNAEALPFPENSFDVTLSLTVLEEGNADRMLAELLRVTRPGGRVAAIVRGDDWPALFAFPLGAEVQAKAARAVSAGSAEGGCADVSLYQRFHAADLQQVRKLPHLAVYDDAQSVMAQFYQSRILSALTPGEAIAWQSAVAQAETQGAFMLSVPHHCAVGVKP